MIGQYQRMLGEYPPCYAAQAALEEQGAWLS